MLGTDAKGSADRSARSQFNTRQEFPCFQRVSDPDATVPSAFRRGSRNAGIGRLCRSAPHFRRSPAGRRRIGRQRRAHTIGNGSTWGAQCDSHKQVRRAGTRPAFRTRQTLRGPARNREERPALTCLSTRPGRTKAVCAARLHKLNRRGPGRLWTGAALFDRDRLRMAVTRCQIGNGTYAQRRVPRMRG